MSARVAGAALVLAWLALWQHAEAQTGKAHRIGALGESPPTTPVFAPLWQGFLAGLHDYGWSEGRNLVIETRFAGDRPESVSDMAAELVAGNVELIVAFGSQATEAARARTRTIPIVTVHASHPVAAGFAASLAKPGGNLTGISNPLEELMAKHLELLKELRPETERVAVLYNPEGRSSYFVAVDATSAAPKLDLAVMPLAVIEPRDLDSAFAAARQAEAQGLVVYPSPLVGAVLGRIAAFAIERRLPTVTPLRTLVQNGLLMSYRPDHGESWRRAAHFVDRILRGAKPGDLPIEQPTRFELVINLKTAKALGIEIPHALLARADEVIE